MLSFRMLEELSERSAVNSQGYSRIPTSRAPGYAYCAPFGRKGADEIKDAGAPAVPLFLVQLIKGILYTTARRWHRCVITNYLGQAAR